MHLVTPEERKAAWLNQRRNYITGSDIAAILGLSKWSSPIKVFLEKKGLADSSADSEAMVWGRRLERPILEAYSEKVGVPLTFADPFLLVLNPEWPLVGATLDATWDRETPTPVDAKNIRQRGSDWGEEGTDDFPVYYQTQLVAQMMVTGTRFADLAVLFSGQQFVPYRLHRDEELIRELYQRLAVWWERHIIGDIPPEVDGSDSSSDYLKEKFARASERVVEPTPEILRLVDQRMVAKEQADKYAALQKEAENKLKALVGDAQEIKGVLTWKNNKDSVVVDWQKVAEEALAHIPDKTLASSLLSTYTTTKPGARVLRFK